MHAKPKTLTLKTDYKVRRSTDSPNSIVISPVPDDRLEAEFAMASPTNRQMILEHLNINEVMPVIRRQKITPSEIIRFVEFKGIKLTEAFRKRMPIWVIKHIYTKTKGDQLVRLVRNIKRSIPRKRRPFTSSHYSREILKWARNRLLKEARM